MTLVMDENQRKTYTFERKLHPDNLLRQAQLKSLKKIIIHNAKKTAEVENKLNDAIRYFPLKSTEAHFWSLARGEIHIVNARGVTRKVRDIDLTNEIKSQLRRDIKIEIRNYKNDEAKASRRFEEFAFDLVSGIFKKIDRDSLIHQKKFFVIFGPHSSLPHAECSYENKNDYLNYKILNIGKNIVVSFDYIFADQAKNVLNQIYSILSAYHLGMDVHIFHFGKIGALRSDISIGDVCIPVSALDENKVMNGDKRAYPINNLLALDDGCRRSFLKHIGKNFEGTTINMTTVLNQTRESLNKSLMAGGDFIEMEWSVMASMDHGYHSNYPNLGKISYYLTGVVSDKPLEGMTLADTEYPKEMMKKVAEAYFSMIAYMDTTS
ncbi:MAG: hypothetical protein NDI94_06095 [Candidatus Woesearchaeota archaeon]|nr:hypothetical protein [Candidatus Woesearchaeota archaeon]